MSVYNKWWQLFSSVFSHTLNDFTLGLAYMSRLERFKNDLRSLRWHPRPFWGRFHESGSGADRKALAF